MGSHRLFGAVVMMHRREGLVIANMFKLFEMKGAGVLLGTLLISVPVFGQIDLSGVWAPLRGQYGQENIGGSDIGDYTGIPINAEGRAVG